MTDVQRTPRQEKWVASVRASLERDTGKTLAEWVAIAKTCPETKQRAQLKWFKDHHGLLQNRAMWVLGEAFGSTSSASADPQAMLDALWTDPAARAIMEAINTAATAHAGAIRSTRKSFTAWSREFQFAAARPLKKGGVMLGLAVTPDADARLSEPKNESWSERLKARLELTSPADLDDGLKALLKAAWERS
jgi:hypothetical protein